MALEDRGFVTCINNSGLKFLTMCKSYEVVQ